MMLRSARFPAAAVAGMLLAGTLLSAPAHAQRYERSWNSWYGPSRAYRDENVAHWAVGTFHGQNGANGNEETVTIRPDGSAEVRARGDAPRYGTFAGETLTIESRISRVEPARGGIVIDGAYYRR